MSQAIILNKFIKYLEFEKEDYLLELDEQIKLFPEQAARITEQKKEFIERNDTLRERLNDNGYCFGFYLAHAAMDHMDKLDWWEHALVDITNWDGQRSSLNEEIALPGTIKNTNIKSAMQPKRKNIIARALNYIVAWQGDKEDSFYFPDMEQLNIIQPDGYVATPPATQTEPNPSEIKRSYFEILDEEAKLDKVKTVRKREKIAGNFTKEQLMENLADDMPEKAIISVHNANHTIRLTRKGKNWMVYDPNYSHKKLTTIHKIGSKSDCIDEIFKIHKTSAISIAVGCFDENATIHFPEYDNRFQTSAASLIKGDGLYIIAKETPNILPKIVKQIDGSPEGKTLLTVITKALTKKTPNDETALHKIAKKSPDALHHLVKQIDDSPEGKALLKVITQALIEKAPDDGWTALHTIARYSPDAMLHLVKLIDDSLEGKALLKAIIQSLTKQLSGSSFWSGLCMMAIHSPDAFRTLEHFLDSSPNALLNILKQIDSPTEKNNLLETIARELKSKNPNPCNWTWTVLYIITLTDSINALLYRQNGLDQLLKILSEKTVDNKTLWQYICDTLPDKKVSIMDAINKHLSGMNNEELVGYEKEVRRALYDKDTKYRGICKKSTLFHGHYVKTDLYLSMLETIRKTIDKNLNEVMQRRNVATIKTIKI